MESMDRLVLLLRSHVWRDKILRTLGFACQLVAARLQGTKLATRFALFGAAVGRTRAFTRFLDDIPMLQTTLAYGIGTEKDGPIERILQVLANLCSQLFFPVEHITLFCHVGVLPQEKAVLWAGRSTTLWAMSLTCNLSRNLLVYSGLRRAKARLQKASSGGRDIRALDARMKLLTLTIIKDLCDLANAVNWLPYKILWNGRLSATHSAAFGVLASVLNMVILSRS